MRLPPVVPSVILASATALGLLVGCAGWASEPPGPDPASTTPTASGSPGSAAPTTSADPSSASSEAPTAGEEVTAAGGALTWTMPCADPAEQNIEGNEEDKKTYQSFRGWRCGEQGSATSGALVLELVTPPEDADAARTAMRDALAQLAPQAKPTDNEVAGRPGIVAETELRGTDFGYQAVSVGSYLALFFVTPPDDLPELADTVKVS